MAQRKALSQLPYSMAERAAFARRKAVEDPASVQVDDDLLPWVFSDDDGVWLSFDGNYSSYSPEEKQVKNLEREKKMAEADDKAYERYVNQLAWSKMRQHVLDRDGHKCQICGATKTNKLHIHHIIKRKDGGTDTSDNLITVCPKCHRTADTKLYDMEWDSDYERITEVNY